MIEPADVDAALLEALRREGLDTLEGALAFRGGRDFPKSRLRHRRRTYLEVTDQSGRTHRLYVKRYGSEGLVARLRRWFAHGPNLSAAEVEWRNIRAVRALGLSTMQAVIRGQEGQWVGGGRSYIIVTAVGGDALSRCGEDFLRLRGEKAAAQLTDRLAAMLVTLHGSGYVHRDLYASHVFLDDRGGGAELYLIDLARMFTPRWRRFRWRVKDLAQLKCSMPTVWTQRHWDDFLAAYLAGCGGGDQRRYNQAVDRKAASIVRRQSRRQLRARASESASS